MSSSAKTLHFSQGSLTTQQRSLLVTHLQKSLFSLLEQGIKAVFIGADEALFRGAEEAQSNDTQRLFFDGIQTLRPLRKQIAEDFLRSHLAEFKAYFSGQAEELVNQSEPSSDELKLSLINNDEYEESLLVKTMASKAQKKHALDLIVLRKRLELLADRTYPKRTQPPVNPETIANSFHRALDKTVLQLPIKTTLYMLFEQEVMSLLDDFYHKLNLSLIKQQILPTLSAEQLLAESKTSSARSSSTPSTVHATQPESFTPQSQASTNQYQSAATFAPHITQQKQAQTRTEAANSTAVNTTEALQFNSQALQLQLSHQLHEINQLLASFRQLEHNQLPLGGKSLEAYAPETATQAYKPQQVLQALQDLQQESAQSLSNTPVTGDTIKQALYQFLNQNNQQAKNFKVGDREVNSIDLVGMIFDFINDDQRLASSSRIDISNLQALYQQLALQDTQFLQKVDHPAHILLDSMSHTSSLFKGASEEKAVKQAINQTVSQALQNYHGDNQVFTELLKKFTELIDELKARSRKREQRAIEAAKGRDKLLAARKQASSLINACLRRYNPPSIIQQFLIHAWSDVLVFVFLRSGPADKQWQSYAKTAEKLAWSGTLLSIEEQQTLASMRTDLMHSVREGLELLGCHPTTEIDRLISDLVDCQTAVQALEKDAAERLKISLSATKAAVEQAKQSPPQAPEIKETDLSDSALSVAYDLKQIKSGTWFEFKQPPCTLKLAWYSTITHNYMFVDSAGQRSQIKSLTQLAMELESGETKIVDPLPSQPIISRALAAAQRTLQRFAGTYKAD